MIIRGQSFALALLAVAATAPSMAQVPVPPLTGRVVDLTATLTAADVASLDQKLAALEARKGSQIAVLIVPTTAPEAIEQFSIRVVDAWQLGRKGVDDGVLLLVAKDDRAMRIEVGRGLEGAIPDAYARRVIDEYLRPAFRAGDFAGGINAAVDRLQGLIDGEPLPPPAQGSGQSTSLEDVLPVVFIVSLIAGGILTRLLGTLPGAAATGALAGFITWLMVSALTLSLFMGLAGFVLALMGLGRGGRWVSHGRGGGGFGGGFGGGGGGFRGGGGGFGGGGASGRW